MVDTTPTTDEPVVEETPVEGVEAPADPVGGGEETEEAAPVEETPAE